MAEVGLNLQVEMTFVMLISFLRTWSGADPAEAERNGPMYYIVIYAAVCGLQFTLKRFLTQVTGNNVW